MVISPKISLKNYVIPIFCIGPDDGPWSRRNKNIHKSNTLFKFDYSKLEKLKKIIEIQTDTNLQLGNYDCLMFYQIKTTLGFDLNKVKNPLLKIGE